MKDVVNAVQGKKIFITKEEAQAWDMIDSLAVVLSAKAVDDDLRNAATVLSFAMMDFNRFIAGVDD